MNPAALSFKVNLTDISKFRRETDCNFYSFTVPPVCQPKGVKVYGVAKMETAHIACNVEANPPEVSFRSVYIKMSQPLIKHISTNFFNFGVKSCQSRYLF